MASRAPRFHPRNSLNDLTGRDWLTFTRTWFATEAEHLPPELAAALERFVAALAEAEAGDEADHLNDLSAAEWAAATASWFLADSRRYWRNKDTELHPARFPEEMCERFIRFFTKQGAWVLDPFAGSGATLVSCAEAGRHGVGLEISET
ncbi:MAG: site-specific DNA-methyltransferase, partial [Armatimonadetes bacterium]|nr:site-specific DNA-methyltransferase [Armatimonadota bacterium]